MPRDEGLAPRAGDLYDIVSIAPGTYAMQWQMNKGGVAFGDTTTLLNIVVILGPDDDQWVSTVGVPTSIGPGLPFNGTITMR